MARANRRQQGMALSLALITVLIISALLSGIMLLSVSHLSLSGTNSAYANALGLAEAGVNWELQKVFRDAGQADQSPATVELPTGSGRSFAVEVEAYPAGGVWVPPSDFWVISTGTVAGVSRTVRVRVAGQGPGGFYALFGIDHMLLGGNFTVNGASGTNGFAEENGNPNLNGNFWYCGDATGEIVDDTPDTSPYVNHAPLTEYFPTVNDLANQRAEDRWGVTTDEGVNYFDHHNDNATIRDAAGNAVGIKNGAIDWKQKGFATAGPTLWDGTPVPAPLQGGKIAVLRPGDYYLEELRFTGSEGIFVDDADGPVNIWLGPENGTGQPDTLTGNSLAFSSGDIDNFHLYEGSKRTLVLEGTVNFYGNIYAYNGPSNSGDYWGDIIFRGNCDIVGSVIGYDVTRVNGTATVTYPSGGGGDGSGDPAASRYRSWEELNGQ